MAAGDPLLATLGPTRKNDPRAYGGHGQDVDPAGNPIAGTSGAEQDIAYYNKLGANGQPAAPTIDQTQSNESRSYQLGSLDTLQRAADGTDTSPAARLGYQQGQDAMNASSSLAASVRGGPMARAAAARAATYGNAQTLARSNLAAAGAQAGAMAAARGQLAGAANGMRSEDLGVATDQAKLQAGQNAANDQHSQHYAQSAYDVANAQNNADVGISAQDAQAAQAARVNAQQSAAMDRQVASTAASTVTGGVMGVAGGYAAAHAGDTTNPNPDPYSKAVSTSDGRAKHDIRPVSDKEAARLTHEAARILPGYRAQLPQAEPAAKAPEYQGKYLPALAYTDKPDVVSGPTGIPARAKDQDTSALHAGIEAQIADDAKNAPRYGYFDEADGGSAPLKLSAAPKGYAAGRVGQQGAMFGNPEPSGPMTQHQREVMTSDDRAKAAAWDEGHAAALDSVSKAAAHPPAELKALAETRPAAAAVRDLKEGAFDEGHRDGMAAVITSQHRTGGRSMDAARAGEAERLAAARQHINGFDEGLSQYNPVEAIRGMLKPSEEAPQSPPPASTGGPGYLAQIAGRARAMVSDADTKYGTHDVGAMASANLSMKPRVYKYKEGFAEHEGQTPDEENVGPIAQDMAANPIAKTVVVQDPKTGLLGIDKDKGLKLVMGGLADLQAQVDSMHKKKASR